MISIKFKDIKIGKLIVLDSDAFMLGNRWLVEPYTDGKFYGKHHYLGTRNIDCSSDLIIEDDGSEYITREYETLENWTEKCNTIKAKIINNEI